MIGRLSVTWLGAAAREERVKRREERAEGKGERGERRGERGERRLQKRVLCLSF